jgi:type II secretory pathway component GspD/PulD (secretin)/Tfp pilus assembly protein PilF
MNRSTRPSGLLALLVVVAASSGPAAAASLGVGTAAGAAGSYVTGSFRPQDPTLDEVKRRQEVINQKRREVAAAHLTQGRAYMAQSRFEDAAKEFESAYAMDPGNQDVLTELDRVNAILGKPGKVPAQKQEFDSARVRFDQAMQTARYHFNLGVKAYTDGDHATAIENFEKVLIILRTNPAVDADFNEAKVREALAQVKAAKETADRERDARRLEEVKSVEREKMEAERTRIERQVEDKLRQACELFKREKFKEVQTVTSEILCLDYTNCKAMRLKEAARRAELDMLKCENIAQHRESWQRVLEEVLETRIPQTANVTYPSLDKWRSIVQKGPIELSRSTQEISEVDADITKRLEGTQLKSVDWQDKKLDEAVKFLRNTTGTNIVIERAVDEKVPEADRNLSLQFESINAAAALKLAVESLKLRYIVEDGLVKITTPEELRKRKVVQFYEVRDLVAKLNSFPSVEINLNPSGAGAGAGGGGEPEESSEENRTIESDRLIEMIKTAVDKPSWDEDPTNTIIDKNGTLVVRQTPENQRAIRELLTNLRRTTGLQVAIESRFISVENNFLQDIGVDWRGLGDNSGGVGVPGKGTAAPFDDFGPSPNFLGSDNSSGAFYNSGPEGDIRGRVENVFNRSLGNTDTLTSSGGFSLQYTYLDDTQLEAILRAVQKYERVNTVTAPKLVVTNTQRANITVINHVAYVKDFDVEIAQAAVIADPIVDVVKEGVILDVRPTISSDRRFVTLELRPTVATLVRPIRTFTTTLGVGTAVTFEVPELRKQSIKTTVVMPDGATLLLGGLKFFEEQDFQSGVPILQDIPVVSFLFSRKGKYTSIQDLIVLLKVKILVPNELEPTLCSPI